MKNELQKDTTIIMGSSKLYWISFCICITGIIGFLFVYAKNFAESPISRIIYFVLLLLFGLFFLFKALKPKVILQFSKEGLWLYEIGLIEWAKIKKISLESKGPSKSARDLKFIIVFDNSNEVILDTNDLKIEAQELERLIQTYMAGLSTNIGSADY